MDATLGSDDPTVALVRETPIYDELRVLLGLRAGRAVLLGPSDPPPPPAPTWRPPDAFGIGDREALAGRRAAYSTAASRTGGRHHQR